MLRYSRLFVNSILLLAMPSVVLYPQSHTPSITFQVQKVNFEEKQIAKDYMPSYDEILRLLDELESGELEKKCTSEQQIENLTHFIALLAKEGVLPDNSPESLSLDDDIEELLNGEDNLYEDALSFVTPAKYRYMIIPAVLHENGEVVICKSWVQKQCKHIKKFAKKHKKALIIGAAVVVAASVVVVAVAAASSAAAAGATATGVAAAAADNEFDKKNQKGDSSSTPSIPTNIPPGMAATQEAPTLRSALNDQAYSFKENIVQNQFFQPINPAIGHQGLSWEENARALGSLFAHDSYNNLQNQIPYYPSLAREVEDINSKYTFPIPGEYRGPSIAHPEIDRKFSTDYTSLYSNPGQEVDFNTRFHQVRGERALAFGYYNQAVQDFGKAIELNPTNPIPYLERGVAHFGLGQYDHSLEDYHQYTSQVQQADPVSVTELGKGFAKELSKGICSSGSGFFLFVSDLVINPVHTARQTMESLSALSRLVRSEDWNALKEILAPEVHQLISEWDSLPSGKKAELAGFALGKHGSDILIPGALTKAVAKGLKGAQELSQIYKGLQTAEQTLLLESVAGLENSAKIAEVVQTTQKTITLGEELGYSARELAQFKIAGELDGALAKASQRIANDPAMLESMLKHDNARNALAKHAKKPIFEGDARKYIHETGFPTFPKPTGIPDNYLVMVSDKGAGMMYVHPENTHISIRVMPGKPHSPHPYQQKPYVVQMESGKAIDKLGNRVARDSPEAHIPLEEFVYRK